MAEDYKFKSYDRLVEESLTDESMAGDIYRYMANISPNSETAATLRKIAADEDRHHVLLSKMLAAIPWLPQYDIITEIERGMGKMSSGGRRFPQTYGEWVDLAEEIKEKDKSPHIWQAVNAALDDIAQDRPIASESQRYLFNKAQELGIT